MEYKEIILLQGSSAWLSWQNGGIGASDAAIIMGENRFNSPKRLLHEKKNQINEPPNSAMMEGTLLETEARIVYEKFVKFKVEPLCIESVEFPWLRASLDGISKNKDSIVEIKCGKSAMREAQRGVIPEYYYGQIQHQLMITGLDKIDYWCYRPEYGGILLEAKRNDPYISKLFKVELEFYAEMQNP
jgi:putative phage-type endonuclease